MAHILVVEDDPVIRRTVEYTLRRAGFETSSSDDGAKALETARREHPDLVLLDVMLPGLDGFEFAERAPRDRQGRRDHDGDGARSASGPREGSRPRSGRLHHEAVRYGGAAGAGPGQPAAGAGADARWLRTRPIELGDVRIEPSQFRVTVKGSRSALRLKEFQLLLALASRPGALMTRQRLAEEVWGYELMPSSRTIDVHVARVRQAVGGTVRLPIHPHGPRTRVQAGAQTKDNRCGVVRARFAAGVVRDTA